MRGPGTGLLGAGMAFIGNDLFIADSGNNAVRKLSSLSGSLVTLSPSVPGPVALAIDTAGAIYVTENVSAESSKCIIFLILFPSRPILDPQDPDTFSSTIPTLNSGHKFREEAFLRDPLYHRWRSYSQCRQWLGLDRWSSCHSYVHPTHGACSIPSFVHTSPNPRCVFQA